MKYNVKTEQGTGTPEKSALKVRVYEEETEPIGTDGIADGAVTSAKIADGAVTADKLAENAIPTASASTLGGVKVGDGLSIDNAGVLSADNETFIIELSDDPNTYQTVVVTDLNDIVQARLNLKIPIVVKKVTSPYNMVIVYDGCKFDYNGVYYSRISYSGTTGQQNWTMNFTEFLIDYTTGVESIVKNFNWPVTQS